MDLIKIKISVKSYQIRKWDIECEYANKKKWDIYFRIEKRIILGFTIGECVGTWDFKEGMGFLGKKNLKSLFVLREWG